MTSKPVQPQVQECLKVSLLDKMHQDPVLSALLILRRKTYPLPRGEVSHFTCQDFKCCWEVSLLVCASKV